MSGFSSHVWHRNAVAGGAFGSSFFEKFGRKNDFAEDHSTENNWLVTVSEFFSSKFLV